MKIAVRAGHNNLATGANGFINEVKENRLVAKYLIDYLKKEGHTVIDVTPNDCDADTDLIYGVSKANENKVDLFVSIHFNAAYTTTQAMGSECITYGDTESNVYATRICDKLSSIGFKNRAVKVNQKLYEVKNTVMTSIIVEVCFVDSSSDVNLYQSLTPNKVARAIAEGITNKAIATTTTNTATNNTINYIVKTTDWKQLGAFCVLDNAKKLAQEEKAIVYDMNNKVVVSYVPVSTEKRYAESGTFYFNVAVTVRTATQENARTNVVYYPGEKVIYHHVILNKNGFNWIEYARSNGTTGYLKIKDLATGESYGYAK